MVTILTTTIRDQEAKGQLDDERDDELLLRFLPEPTSPCSDVEQVLDDGGSNPEVSVTTSRKRGFSSIAGLSKFSPEVSFPPLASVARIQEFVGHGCANKKQALLAREKLRAGLHDPKGLLKMVGCSTNALERAKKMEILKSSGLMFGVSKKSEGKTSLSDKLNVGKTRL